MDTPLDNLTGGKLSKHSLNQHRIFAGVVSKVGAVQQEGRADTREEGVVASWDLVAMETLLPAPDGESPKMELEQNAIERSASKS